MKSSPLARRTFAVAMMGLLVSCGDSSGPGAFVPFIVFDSDRTDDTRVFRMNLDGSNVQQLTTEVSYYGAVDNSGTLLAFTNENDRLHLKNLITGSVTALAGNTSNSFRPALNKEGTLIAFVSERDGGDREIWIINSNGTGLTRLTNRAGEDSYPAFTPDGQRIVFTCRQTTGDICVMNSDGSGFTNLTNHVSEDAHSSFFPDGSKILFSSNRNGDYDLYTMNPDGTGQTLLFHRDGREFGAALTPDGTRVVFYGSPLVAGPSQIYIANLDGTGLTNLSNSDIHETRTGGIIPGGS